MTRTRTLAAVLALLVFGAGTAWAAFGTVGAGTTYARALATFPATCTAGNTGSVIPIADGYALSDGFTDFAANFAEVEAGPTGHGSATARSFWRFSNVDVVPSGCTHVTAMLAFTTNVTCDAGKPLQIVRVDGPSTWSDSATLTYSASVSGTVVSYQCNSGRNTAVDVSALYTQAGHDPNGMRISVENGISTEIRISSRTATAALRPTLLVSWSP